MPERWFTHTCYCCPPQVARTVAKMHRWAYGLSEDTVWIHIYGGSRLETEVAGGAFVLEQVTDYPWEGTVRIKIEQAPQADLTIKLRVPAWARNARVSVGGQQVSVTPGSYASIERTWNAGDTIEIDFGMEAELVTAHPRLEQDRNQVAVVRGPMVYCLEEVDLPKGVRIEEIHLPQDFAPRPRFEPGLLSGVTVLEGTASRAQTEAWGNDLYRRKEARKMEPVDIRLIPYFAWHNRGNGEMAVWFPLIS
jgi:DUF1680 family protein